TETTPENSRLRTSVAMQVSSSGGTSPLVTSTAARPRLPKNRLILCSTVDGGRDENWLPRSMHSPVIEPAGRAEPEDREDAGEARCLNPSLGGGPRERPSAPDPAPADRQGPIAERAIAAHRGPAEPPAPPREEARFAGPGAHRAGTGPLRGAGQILPGHSAQ